MANKPTLRTVVFNEGEPLDPNKLNDLYQNIKTVYEMAVKSYGSDGSYKTNFDSGSVVIAVKDGVGDSEIIKSTTLTNKPLLIATIAGNLKPGVQATLSIVNEDSNPQIRVSVTPKVTRSLKINYILVEKELTA
jgi:hypothetical protein